MSVGMSLVISSGFGFDRIPCIYVGSKRRKSTESSSKSSRNLRATLGNAPFRWDLQAPMKPDIFILRRHRGSQGCQGLSGLIHLRKAAYLKIGKAAL